MTTKDFIVIALLIVILIVAIYVLREVKAPKQVLTSNSNTSVKEADIYKEEKVIDKEKKIKVKTTYRRILKMFNDDMPHTEDELLNVYNSNHKEIKASKLRSICKWLNNKGLLMFEDIEGVGIVWGLPDFFEDGELSQEYFKLLKK